MPGSPRVPRETSPTLVSRGTRPSRLEGRPSRDGRGLRTLCDRPPGWPDGSDHPMAPRMLGIPTAPTGRTLLARAPSGWACQRPAGTRPGRRRGRQETCCRAAAGDELGGRSMTCGCPHGGLSPARRPGGRLLARGGSPVLLPAQRSPPTTGRATGSLDRIRPGVRTGRCADVRQRPPGNPTRTQARHGGPENRASMNRSRRTDHERMRAERHAALHTPGRCST